MIIWQSGDGNGRQIYKLEFFHLKNKQRDFFLVKVKRRGMGNFFLKNKFIFELSSLAHYLIRSTKIYVYVRKYGQLPEHFDLKR